MSYEIDPSKGKLKPLKVHTILFSLMQIGDITVSELEKQILENVVDKAIPQKYLDSDTKFIINPK